MWPTHISLLHSLVIWLLLGMSCHKTAFPDEGQDFREVRGLAWVPSETTWPSFNPAQTLTLDLSPELSAFQSIFCRSA